MTTRMLHIAAACSLIAAVQAGAQDNPAGESLYQEVCRNCHGPSAQGLASYPKLAGKDEAYIVDRLEQYRAGEKVGPNSPLMIPHAAELSDQEIADLASYVTTAFD